MGEHGGGARKPEHPYHGRVWGREDRKHKEGYPIPRCNHDRVAFTLYNTFPFTLPIALILVVFRSSHAIYWPSRQEFHPEA